MIIKRKQAFYLWTYNDLFIFLSKYNAPQTVNKHNVIIRIFISPEAGSQHKQTKKKTNKYIAREIDTTPL